MAARMRRPNGARRIFPHSGRAGIPFRVSYRAIAWLASSAHERQAYGDYAEDAYCTAVSGILDRLQAAGPLRI